MASLFRIATLLLVFPLAALPAFAAEPAADTSFPSGATRPERGLDNAHRGAMVECPAGSDAYCPVSADCLCIDEQCMCVKPEWRDLRKPAENRDTYAECKRNCRSAFDSQLGACNMHDWDPLGSEYKSCVKAADNNYAACLNDCKGIKP